MVIFSAGLDLSGKQNTPSGLSIVGVHQGKLSLQYIGILFGDHEIMDKLSEYNVAVVAIDAPLSKLATTAHFRAVDLRLRKMGFKVLPLTWKGMSLLVERALSISTRLRENNVLVVETHPSSSLKSSRCKDVFELALKHGLSLPRGLSRHERDSFIAGLTGVYHYQGRAIVVRDVDGEVVLLPRIC